jgi:hypothetical protein
MLVVVVDVVTGGEAIVALTENVDNPVAGLIVCV